MESDISLIEIAGEDDSLLQQIPADDIAAVNTGSYFSCSPLQSFRSRRVTEASRLRPTEDPESNKDEDKPTCSSHGDSSNKENVNGNKFGVPKLRVEPQQMKKRKTGRGYNLRKSLAWDRAFFTEEGVLNPLELSMVSGNFGAFSGEGLSVINEEETKSVSGDLDCSKDSAELQALEEKLFKELPVSTSNGGKSIGGCTQPIQDASSQNDEAPAPAPAVLRKVLSVHHMNRSGSKRGGFSRPLSSASQKRQANTTTKVASKDARLPKVPVPKPDPCLLTTTSKSASWSTTHLKRNHIAHPGVIVPKSAGLKGSSSKFTSTQNNAKLGPDLTSFSVKSSVPHARRNVASALRPNPPLEINSSVNLQPELVTKVNSGFEVTQDIELPAASANREYPSVSGYNGSNKTAVSLPHNAQSIGGNLQYGQPRTVKASGLRMPSPSLGLFSQPKASASLLQKNQTCNLPKPTVPNFQKLHASNCTETGNITALTSSSRCSISSAAKPVFSEAEKLNFEVNNLDKSKLKFSCVPKSYKVVKDSTVDRADRHHHEHAELHNIEIPRKEDSKLQFSDHKLLSQKVSCKLENSYISAQQNQVVQVRDVCEADGITEHHNVEEILVANQHGSSESGSSHTISCSKAGISVVKDGQLVNMLDTREEVGEQEQVNLTTCCTQPDLISLVENRKAMDNDDILFQRSSFEDSHNHVNGNIVDTKVQGSSTSTLENCQQPSQHTKESSKDAIEVDEFINKSHEQDAPTLCLNGNLLVESCKKNLSTCSRYLMIADDLIAQSGERKPKNPVVELFHEVDTPFVQRVKLNGEVIPMEFGSSLRISKEQTTCEVMTPKSTATNFHPESRDNSGCEPEGAHSKFLFSPEVQVRSVCGTEKMIEEREYKSPVENQAVTTNAQCQATIGDGKEVASGLQNNQPSCMPVAKESSDEQIQQIGCCSSGADQISNNEDQNLQTEDSISPRSSQKNEGCVTDIDRNICGYNVSDHGIDSTTEKSPEKYADRASIGSDLVVEGCRSNLSEQMKLQIPCLVVKQSSQDEFQEKNDSEIPELSYMQETVPHIPTTVFHLPEKMNKHLNTKDAVPDSGDFKSSVEGQQYLTGTQLRHELNSQATLNKNDLSMKLAEDKSDEALTSCRLQEFHFSSCESRLSLQHVESSPSGSIQQCVGLNDLESGVFPEKAETKVCQESNSTSNILLHQLDDAVYSTEKDDLIPHKQSENDNKKDAPVINPPLGAVPFSDEWLTAIEAAGEEILTLKSGPVQNSPPDKPLPEPGPWSPVKKGNQELGPFDCTKKFTHIPPPADPN